MSIKPYHPKYNVHGVKLTPASETVYTSIHGIWKDRVNLNTMLVRLRKIIISNPENIPKLSGNRLLQPGRTVRVSQEFKFPTFSVCIRAGLFNGIRLYIFVKGKTVEQNVDFVLFTNSHRSIKTIVKEDCDSFNDNFFNSQTVTQGYAPEEVLGELHELICDYTNYEKLLTTMDDAA
jgi:hypothetical protein